MKKIENEKIDITTPENVTNYDISISNFNIENAYIELPEELDAKLIGYIEKEVRNSYEYKAYVSYLKNELDLTRCSLLPGINIKEMNVSLEFHHYPMNLFEIVETVGNQMVKNCKEGEKISCFDIAQKVVEEHYLNNIGLVPLTKTLHDMAHNKAIIIPMNKIHGNYKAFLRKYSDYISDDIRDRITEAEMNNDSDESKLYNQTKLEKNISHYNVDYIRSNDNGDDGLDSIFVEA